MDGGTNCNNNDMKFALEWPDTLKQRLKLNNDIIKDTFKQKDFIEATSKQIDIGYPSKQYPNKEEIDSLLHSKIKALESIKATLIQDAELAKAACSAQSHDREASVKPPPHQQSDNDKNKPDCVYKLYKLQNDSSELAQQIEIPPYSILGVKYNHKIDLTKLISVTNYAKFHKTLYSYYYAMIENDPLTIYCQYFHNNIICNHKLQFKTTQDMQTRIRKRFRYHCQTHHFNELNLANLFDTVNPMIWNSIRHVLTFKPDLTEQEQSLKIEQIEKFDPPKSTQHTEKITKIINENTVLEEYLITKQQEYEKKLKATEKTQHKYDKLMIQNNKLKDTNNILIEKLKKIKTSKVATLTTTNNKVTKPNTPTIHMSAPKIQISKQLNILPLEHQELLHDRRISNDNNNNSTLASSPQVINDNFNNLMNVTTNNEPLSVMSPMYHDNHSYGLPMNPNALPEYQPRLQNTSNQLMIPSLDMNNQTHFNTQSISMQAAQPRLQDHHLLHNSRNIGDKGAKFIISSMNRNIKNISNISNIPPDPRLRYNNW